MCGGGRIVNYLKAMLGDPRHDVLLIGYQAAGTPGRDIQKHGPRGGHVDRDGQRYAIRAGIHTLGGYSAHADQKDLLNFIGRMRNRPRQVRLVHGDAAAKEALAAWIQPEISRDRCAGAMRGGARSGAEHPASHCPSRFLARSIRFAYHRRSPLEHRS